MALESESSVDPMTPTASSAEGVAQDASPAANDNTLEDDEEEVELYRIPDDACPVFFPPWALEGTWDAKLYCALYTEVVLTIQPQDIFDEMDAVDITDSFWQQQRIRASIHDIIKAARPDALATILAPMAAHHFDIASEWSRDYFSGGPAKRKSVEGLLRAHGLGPDVIAAQAVMQRSRVIQVLTRVTTALGIHRQDILSASAERRAARAKVRKRRAA